MADDTAYLASDALQGRLAGSVGGFSARQFIADRFAALNLQPPGPGGYYQYFASPYGDTANVIGILPGQDHEFLTEVVVLGAHYDHLGADHGQIYHGAHDDAAGTAAVMEIARVMTGLRGILKRTVVFVAFDGEEEGELGSKHYVENPVLSPLRNTIYMINLDQIGYLNVSQHLNASWAGSSPAAEAMLLQIAGKYPAALPIDTSSRWENSDHYPFVRAGVPVVYFLTSFDGTPYHTPQDTADRLDYSGVTDIARISLELLWRVNQSSSGVIGSAAARGDLLLRPR